MPFEGYLVVDIGVRPRRDEGDVGRMARAVLMDSVLLLRGVVHDTQTSAAQWVPGVSERLGQFPARASHSSALTGRQWGLYFPGATPSRS